MIRAFRVEDIRAAEEPLLAAGVPLMEQAAYALANAVIIHLRHTGALIPGSTALVLVGPGNNGADALFAAAYLARRGLAVTAACAGIVHEAGLADARRAGVRILENPDPDTLATAGAAAGTWIDGLLGIGARGGLREPLASWVTHLNKVRAESAAEPYVVAVDVPSGVGVDDGTVHGPVLRADATVTMGAPKRALYLPPACHYAGEINCVPLGFEPYLPAVPALASLSDSDVRDLWIVPGVDDHKYTRGVVGVLAGSAAYPGAGMLAVAGARAVGPGMVRYVGSDTRVVTAYPDVVTAHGRTQAWTIGSGLDELSEASQVLHRAIAEAIPAVLDATAIHLVYTHDVPSTVVITPHEGELAALLQARGEELSRDDVHRAPARAARLAATLTGATVVLKGAVNVVAGPHGPLYAQGGAPSWLATAGAGDVLAGVMGALLAMYGDEIQAWGSGRGLPGQLAAAACHVHARAAQIAACSGSVDGVSALPIYSCAPRGAGICAHGIACTYAMSRVPRPCSTAVNGGVTRHKVGRPITAADVAELIPWALFEILNSAP